MIRPPQTLLTVACPPHIHCGRTISGYMLNTLIALIPAILMAIFVHGILALRIMALASAVAITTETLCWKIMERPNETDNFNALLIGLLFAFLLPVTAPWWLVTTGSAISIVLGKAIFGGLGGSPFCAPLIGWAALQVSWPEQMSIEFNMLNCTFVDHLALLKHFGVEAVANISTVDLILGRQASGLGTFPVLALLLGGVYLLLCKNIRWHLPLSFLFGVCIASSFFYSIEPATHALPSFHLFAGSTIFAAFFLITDTSSSPVGRIPRLCYGFIAGVLLMIMREWGTHPDGVAFALLVANLLSPMLEKIRPCPFGAQASRGGNDV